MIDQVGDSHCKRDFELSSITEPKMCMYAPSAITSILLKCVN